MTVLMNKKEKPNIKSIYIHVVFIRCVFNIYIYNKIMDLESWTWNMDLESWTWKFLSLILEKLSNVSFYTHYLQGRQQP